MNSLELKTTALFMIALIVLWPLSIMDVKAQEDEFKLEFDVPEYTNEIAIDVAVSTENATTLKLYVNNEIDRVGFAEFGSFRFNSVQLLSAVNIIKVVAEKDSESATLEKTVNLDVDAPIITVNEIPAFAQEGRLVIEGNVNEISNLNILVSGTEEEAEQGIELIDVEGSFSQEIGLYEGVNNIKITATDKVGNEASVENEIVLDTQSPVILDTNLNALSPTYTPDVVLRGSVQKREGEKVKIFVYINDEEKYEEVVDDDGNFSIEIHLERETYSKFEEEDYGESYKQDVGPQDVKWENKVKIVAVDESGLSSEVEEIITYAICGYGSWWDVELGDVTPGMLIPRLIIEGMAEIGFGFNLNWQGGFGNATIKSVDVGFMPLSAEMEERYDKDWVYSPRLTSSYDKEEGYVLIKLKRQSTRLGNLTMFQMEENISRHRMDKCDLSNFGCVRIPVMLEIEFASEEISYIYNESRSYVQKTCIDIEIPIDRRIPPDKIPEDFLRASIDFLNETIEHINKILDPLKTIKKLTFYTCAVSWVLDFAMHFSEKLSCEVVAAIPTSRFALSDAKTGQCDKAEYTDEKKDACETCSQAIESRLKVEEGMRWVCDRIFCPAAPTFQKYVREHSKGGEKYSLFEKLYGKESDCSGASQTHEGIKEIDEWYEDETMQEECSKLHPTNEECCGYEYMNEWNSACVLMDELLESRCLAAQNEQETDDEDCTEARALWNSIAGFCEPDGQPVTDQVNTLLKFKKDVTPCTGEMDNKIYILVVPPQEIGGVERKDYTIAIACADRLTEIEKSEKKIEGKDMYSANEKISFVAVKEINDLFKKQEKGETEKEEKGETDSERNKNIKKFMGVVNSYADPNTQLKPDKAEEYYKEVEAKAGLTDKEYIVDPTSSFLRSVQCVCLPGVTGYLALYRNIMMAVKNCFQTILLTGDGSSGMCRAVLSVYICDLVYDIIKCFVKKYATGPTKYSEEPSIGNFLKALTQAGSAVQQSVVSRYGESGLFKTMFSERKLIHSICLFAFTGTWDLDINEILEEDITTPIESKGFVYPCKRRFMHYDPTSNPPGLTTWTYSFGVGLIAGWDIDYRVKFVCSDDYSCDGPCDCVQIGKQEMTIPLRGGTGFLRKGELFESEEYVSVNNAPYRYDKVILEWSAQGDDKSSGENPPTCEIGEVGVVPSTCEIDLPVGRFRCGFELGDENWARFSKTPVAALPGGVREFSYEPATDLAYDVEIEQQIPLDTDCHGQFCEYTKALYVVVKDGDRQIWPTDPDDKHKPVKILNTGGTNTYTVPDDIPIIEEMFTGGSVITGGCDKLDTIELHEDLKDYKQVGFRKASGCQVSTLIKYDESEKKFGYAYVGISKKDENNYIDKSGFPTEFSDCDSYKQNTNELKCGSVTVLFPVSPKYKPKDKDIVVLGYSVTEQGEVTGCDSKAHTWTAEFTMYDYVLNENTGEYEVSQQPTKDYNGKEQKKTARTTARCKSTVTGPGETQCEKNKLLTPSQEGCVCGEGVCGRAQKEYCCGSDEAGYYCKTGKCNETATNIEEFRIGYRDEEAKIGDEIIEIIKGSYFNVSIKTDIGVVAKVYIDGYSVGKVDLDNGGSLTTQSYNILGEHHLSMKVWSEEGEEETDSDGIIRFKIIEETEE